MKKLPIGISTFSIIRAKENNYLYVDKTHHLSRMQQTGGKYYFLSRPRRFGKSLLIDTLKQAFLANKALFKGLQLEKHWDWGKKYPVIHISFGGGSSLFSEKNLRDYLHTTLNEYAARYNISFNSETLSNNFRELVQKIYQKTQQQVVILVDEYDKPILDVIDKPDEAAINREILRGFYGTIKSLDAELRFVMLTGVSKFSKVSLFSDLNNLNDISLSPHYADICGYNQSELESTFAEYLKDGQVDRAELRRWYNGYNFSGRESQKVYNPFDILLFCDNNYRYRNYWFETGTPSFLIKLIKQNNYFIPSFECLRVTEGSISNFEIDDIPLPTILFQTGYLTIKKELSLGGQYGYVLTYPNVEVRSSLNAQFMQLGNTLTKKNKTFYNLIDVLEDENFSDFKAILNSHFASIPHDWYRNNPIGQYEGFYASIVYSCFAALGYDVRAEDATNIGKIDLSINAPDKVLIIEFKLAKYGNAQQALKQIKDKAYADKFKAFSKPIYLIGMSFDDEQKQVQEVLVEKLT